MRDHGGRQKRQQQQQRDDGRYGPSAAEDHHHHHRHRVSLQSLMFTLAGVAWRSQRPQFQPQGWWPGAHSVRVVMLWFQSTQEPQRPELCVLLVCGHEH